MLRALTEAEVKFRVQVRPVLNSVGAGGDRKCAAHFRFPPLYPPLSRRPQPRAFRCAHDLLDTGMRMHRFL